MKLGKPTATCGCVRVEISDDQILPGESVDAVLSVNVKSQKSLPFWRQNLFFEESDGANVRIEIVAPLDGLLAFQDPSFLVEIAGGAKSDQKNFSVSKSLRFTATRPIDIKDLKLSLNPYHPGIKAVVRSTEEGEGEIVLNLDVLKIGNDPISLSVRLEDEQHAKSVILRGVVARRPAISVFPSAVRFSRNDDGELQGSAVVYRYDNLSDNEKLEKSSAYVRASVFGKPLQVTTSQVSEELARIVLAIPKEIEENFAGEKRPVLKWDIVWGKERANPTSRMFIIDKNLTAFGD